MPLFTTIYRAGSLYKAITILLLAAGLHSHAQDIEVTTKLTGVKKMEEFRLYNEPGRQDPAKFTTEIKIGYASKAKWNWAIRNNSSDYQLSYISDYGFDYHANDPETKRYLSSKVEQKIIEGLFGYKSTGRSYVNGTPEHYFDADGDSNTDLVFTYYSWRDPSRKWEINGRLYDIYVDQPVVTFFRVNPESIQSAIAAERVCYNGVPASRTRLTTNLGNRFKAFFVDDKEFKDAKLNFDTILTGNPSVLKISLQRADGYQYTFDKPVNTNGRLATCPVVSVNEGEIVYALKKQAGNFLKMIRMNAVVSPVHDTRKAYHYSPDESYVLPNKEYGNTLDCWVMAGESFLTSPIDFSDGWSKFSIPETSLTANKTKFRQAPPLPDTTSLFTIKGDGIEMVNASTVLIIADSLVRSGRKNITIEPARWFIADGIWAGDKQLEKGQMIVTEDMNGRKIELTFRDVLKNKATATLTVLLKDGAPKNPLPLSELTSDNNYKRYFQSIRKEEPKGKFVWIKEKKRHLFDNTTVDLTRPFRMQFKMNEASRVPDIVFGVNPNTDFLRIRLSGDSAILQEEHADGTILPKGFVFPISRRNDRTVVFERRDNYLAEGSKVRRDYLLINDKPFIHFKTTDLSTAYNAKMGFDMSTAGTDFKFTEVWLSEHTYKETAPVVTAKPLTLHSGLTRYLLNSTPDDNIDYEGDVEKQKELFRQMQENNYALIVSNYEYKVKVIDFPDQVVAGARDSLVEQLQSYQFKKENIITLNNLTYDSLRKVFAHLFGGGSMTSPASLDNIRKIFPSFNTDGRAKANIYFHYIGHATEHGIAPVDIVDKTDAFPVNDWLRKANTGEAVAIKNFLYVQDACHNSIQNLQPLAYSYSNLVDHLYQYDATTTGREVILASKETITNNFNLTRGIIRVLSDFSTEAGAFSIRELFKQLKTAGHTDAINFELSKLPQSQERSGSFIFYPKYLINED